MMNLSSIFMSSYKNTNNQSINSFKYFETSSQTLNEIFLWHCTQLYSTFISSTLTDKEVFLRWTSTSRAPLEALKRSDKSMKISGSLRKFAAEWIRC